MKRIRAGRGCKPRSIWMFSSRFCPVVWMVAPLRFVSTERKPGIRCSPGVERAFPLKPFPGASDYFELRFPAHYEWLGSFYVETEKGARYWLNGGDTSYSAFLLGLELVHSVEQAVGWFGDRGVDKRAVDIGSLSKTADVFPALNVRRCR